RLAHTLGNVLRIVLHRDLLIASELRQDQVERQERRTRREAHCGAVTAPGPVLCTVAEASSNGVQDDVARQLDEVPVALEQPRTEPALEKMAVDPVATIE